MCVSWLRARWVDRVVGGRGVAGYLLLLVFFFLCLLCVYVQRSAMDLAIVRGTIARLDPDGTTSPVAFPVLAGNQRAAVAATGAGRAT